MMGPVYPGYLIDGVVYLNFIDCNCNCFSEVWIVLLIYYTHMRFYLQCIKDKIS